jgi:hypothetical protein
MLILLSNEPDSFVAHASFVVILNKWNQYSYQCQVYGLGSYMEK